MTDVSRRTVCWTAMWDNRREGPGLEHLLLGSHSADSVIIAFDEERGPFRLAYRLNWDDTWQLHDAHLVVSTPLMTHSLHLETDGCGHWRHHDGRVIAELNGCQDIDIWPTPFTNSFPIRRVSMAVGERQEFCMAWIFAPDLTLRLQRQAYTRVSERRYLFENLDGTRFEATLSVDADGLVIDYPHLFGRLI